MLATEIQSKARFTLGQVASMLNVSVHRVQYAVVKAGIEPTQRSQGNWRLFNSTEVEAIAESLDEIADARR